MKNHYLRYFIIVGVAFFLFSLTLSCAKKVESDKALTLLPKDSTFLFSVDMKKLAATALYNKIKEDTKTLEKYNEFVEKTGVDPEKHVERIILAIPPDVEETQEVAIVVFGTFDREKILSAIEEKGEIETSTYEGLDVYSFTPDDEPMSMSFLAEGCIAFGGQESIKRMIELSKGKGESIEANAEMMDVLKDIHQEDMFWGAGLIPEGYKQKAMANPMTKSFASLRSIILSINAEKGFDFFMLSRSDVEEDAKLMADAMKGFVALGKMGVSEKPDILEVLDKIVVESKKNEVTISMQLSEDLMERLGKEMQKQFGDWREHSKGPEIKPESENLKEK